MTLTEVIETVRAIVHDDAASLPGGAEVLSDDTYAIFVNDGMRQIFDKYADSRIDAAGLLRDWAPASVLSPTTALVIDDVYRNALVEFVCYRFYNRDSGDTRDVVRASEHFKRFNELLAPR